MPILKAETTEQKEEAKSLVNDAFKIAFQVINQRIEDGKNIFNVGAIIRDVKIEVEKAKALANTSNQIKIDK